MGNKVTKALTGLKDVPKPKEGKEGTLTVKKSKEVVFLASKIPVFQLLDKAAACISAVCNAVLTVIMTQEEMEKAH